MEERLIDASRPPPEVLEADRGELFSQGSGGDHAPSTGVVKSPEDRVGETDRNPGPSSDIFGITGVIAGREAQLSAQAFASDCPADGRFSEDVHRIRPEFVEGASNRPARRQRNFDLGVPRK